MIKKLPGLVSVYMEELNENLVKEVGPFGVILWHRDGDGWTAYSLEEVDENAPSDTDTKEIIP